jgi:hypothetical protein
VNQQFPGIFADVENIAEHVTKIMWSAFYFALSYILLSYLSYAVQALNASLLDYPVSFSFDGIKILEGSSPWTLKRIAFIFLAPPLFGLFTSIAATIAYTNTTFTYSHLKLIFYWLCINGFALFYSYFFTGIITFGDYNSKYFTGFAAYFAWLHLEKSTVTGLLFVFAILFSFYALTFGRKTLSQSYSTELLEKEHGRSVIFINVLVLPFIIGTALILAATYPMDFNYQIIRLFCYPIIFAMVFIWLQVNRHAACIIKKGGIEYYHLVWLLASTAVLILISRFLFG